VEVQVVPRQVGEATDGEPGAVHPAEGQRVARHLHRHVRHAPLGHHREQRLQVRRFWRGERTREPLPRDPGLHGPDQPGRETGGPQPGIDHVGGRGLAGRAGDPEHRQTQRRLPVDPRGDRPEQLPRIVVHEHGHIPQPRPPGTGLVGQHGDRPGTNGVGGEVGTVDTSTGQRGEQISRHNVLCTQRSAGNRHLRGGRSERTRVRPRHQRGERDWRDPCGAWRCRHGLANELGGHVAEGYLRTEGDHGHPGADGRVGFG
jgi:hypothetical protein